MNTLFEVTYRHVTAVHYKEGKKYMIWYYAGGDPRKTVGVVQVRGISEPLTEAELKHHIDKLWERAQDDWKTDQRHGVAGVLKAKSSKTMETEAKAKKYRSF